MNNGKVDIHWWECFYFRDKEILKSGDYPRYGFVYGESPSLQLAKFCEENKAKVVFHKNGVFSTEKSLFGDFSREILEKCIVRDDITFTIYDLMPKEDINKFKYIDNNSCSYNSCRIFLYCKCFTEILDADIKYAIITSNKVDLNPPLDRHTIFVPPGNDIDKEFEHIFSILSSAPSFLEEKNLYSIY